MKMQSRVARCSASHPLVHASQRSKRSTTSRPPASPLRHHYFTFSSPPPATATTIATLSPSSSSAEAQTETVPTNNLPLSPVQMTDQAAASVSAALADGILRQDITFLLPINEKERRFTATESDDYPCSLQKEFDVACSLTTALLQRVLNNPSAKILAKRLDDGGVEGEPCAVLYPDPKSLSPTNSTTGKPSIAAVVYPTSDRLPQINKLAQETDRPLLIINSQWREEGQVISDFGIGPWKKAALDFLAQFEPTYVIKEKRIGSPGTINGATGTRFVSGGVIRVVRQWETRDYQVYAMSADGSSQQLTSVATEPKYQQLEELIQQGRSQKLEIFEVAKKATYVYADAEEEDDDELEEGTDGEGVEESGGGGNNNSSSFLSDADIDALDAASARRLLAGYGAPGSGKLSKLKERLKEVQAAAIAAAAAAAN